MLVYKKMKTKLEFLMNTLNDIEKMTENYLIIL